MSRWISAGVNGSSPLARGTLDQLHQGRPQRRFIPAGAGNTCRCNCKCSNLTVHPRWRGEHSCQACASIPARGSSPLARGTLQEVRLHRGIARFIPAGAGNTRSSTLIHPGAAVHPRWRGEHDALHNGTRSPHGSSPLARGTPEKRANSEGVGRFIPAGAGNTSWSSRSTSKSPVHPRWRGEHMVPCIFAQCVCGSSPLARGTLGGRERPGASERFIPAGAGNTSCLSISPARRAVHPRWRGEHERLV